MPSSLRISELLLMAVAVLLVAAAAWRFFTREVTEPTGGSPPGPGVAELDPTESALARLPGVKRATQYTLDGAKSVLVVLADAAKVTPSERERLVSEITNVIAADTTVQRVVLVDQQGGGRLDWLSAADGTTSPATMSAGPPGTGQ